MDSGKKGFRENGQDDSAFGCRPGLLFMKSTAAGKMIVLGFLCLLLRPPWIAGHPGDIIPSSTRFVVTFETNALAVSASDLDFQPLNATVVKQYSRRLVLDLGRPIDVDYDSRAIQDFFADLNLTLVGVEPDLLISSVIAQQMPVIGTEWQYLDAEPYSLQMEAVWYNFSLTGSPNVTVASLDGGLAREAYDHLFANLVPGYDFISDPAISLDGDGRDAQPIDPGYNQTGGCPPPFHGTMTAGLISGRHDAVPGIRSMQPDATLLPVRVLGACGIGYANDVADAIIWAVGGDINGLENNPAPAGIVSMSFVGQGGCPSYLQSAVTIAVARFGAILVAAAGNNAGDAGSYFPANCVGVVPVGASTRRGALAEYSNGGSLLLVAAPGGDWENPIFTCTLEDGQLARVAGYGSSFSAAFVSGMFALKLSVPELNTSISRLFYADERAIFNPNIPCTPTWCGPGIESGIRLITGSRRVVYGLNLDLPSVAGNASQSAQSMVQGAGSCAAGAYSTGSDPTCILCSPGVYASITGGSTCTSCAVGFYATGSGATACVANPVPISYYLVPQTMVASPNSFYCSGSSSQQTVCGTGGCTSGCQNFAVSADNNTGTMYNAAASNNVAYSLDYCFPIPVLPQTYYMMMLNGDSTHDRGSWTARTAAASGGPYTTVQTFAVTRGVSPRTVQFSPLATTPALCWNMLTEVQTYQIYMYEAYWSAVFCPYGFYLFSTLAGCYPCNPGTYSITWGTGSSSATCQTCGAGTYSTTYAANGSSTCLRCGAGTFSTGIGMISSATCSLCAAGSYSSGTGISTSASCTFCVAGTYSSGSGIAVSAACTMCYAGTYSTGSGIISSFACVFCIAGTFSSGSGMPSSSSCAPCPANAWSATTGATACFACQSNTISVAGATACKVNAGYYDLGGSLLAYYPFNPDNMTRDISGKTGSLTNIGGVTSNVPGSPPVSWSLPSGAYAANLSQPGGLTDGNSLMQYMTMPAITIPTNFTICFWFNPQSSQTSMTSFDIINGVNYNMFFYNALGSSNQLQIWVYLSLEMVRKS